MFNVLTGLAMGIVIFAITIGVGVVVLTKFGSSVASCPTDFSYYNTTTELCNNATGSTVNPSSSTVTVNSLTEQLGTSGLAGWTGAIIALAVGLLFIGALIGKRKY